MATQKIRFCNICDNKYYHHVEDESLIYFCRICGNKDTSLSNERLCVLNIDYSNKETKPIEHMVNKYTKFDPTLPHISIPCPNAKCKTNKENKNNSDVIYMRYDEQNMRHLYICTICDEIWKTHET